MEVSLKKSLGNRYWVWCVCGEWSSTGGWPMQRTGGVKWVHRSEDLHKMLICYLTIMSFKVVKGRLGSNVHPNSTTSNAPGRPVILQHEWWNTVYLFQSIIQPGSLPDGLPFRGHSISVPSLWVHTLWGYRTVINNTFTGWEDRGALWMRFPLHLSVQAGRLFAVFNSPANFDLK